MQAHTVCVSQTLPLATGNHDDLYALVLMASWGSRHALKGCHLCMLSLQQVDLLLQLLTFGLQ